jgi:hypothetical protein
VALANLFLVLLASVALTDPILHASLPPFAHFFLLLSAPLFLLQWHLFAVLIALVALLIFIFSKKIY